MFYIIPIFILIMVIFIIGQNIIKIFKEKSNGEKILGKTISIIGIIIFVSIFFFNFIGIIGGGFNSLLMFLPFIGILFVFLGVFISKLEDKHKINNNNQVKVDDDGNYIFGLDDENK